MNEDYNQAGKIKTSRIPADVLSIMKKLQEDGFESYLVGGCVRDLLYDKPGKDWDIATDAAPVEIQQTFRGIKTLMIGKSFQTVTLIFNKQVYQISTFRNIRKPGSVSFTNKLDLVIEDLMLRDFTINAMAWNPDRGLLDPANGWQDLRHKMVRSINPDNRFKEDPIRMLRAIRLACELKFSISRQTKKSMIYHAFLICLISPERIREELCLILKSNDAERGIVLLRQFGLERYIFSMDGVKKELLTVTRKKKQVPLSGLGMIKENLSAQLALWGRLYSGSCRAACVCYLPVIKYLRFKRRIIHQVEILLSREWEESDFGSGRQIRFLISQLGQENARILMSLKEILLLSENHIEQKNKLEQEKILFNKELNSHHPYKLSDLAITGDDIKKMGLPEGQKIGDILKITLKEILVHPEKNNRDYLVKFTYSIISNQEQC